MHQSLLTIAVGQTFFAAVLLIFGPREGKTRSSLLLGVFVLVYGVSFLQEIDAVAMLYTAAPILVPLTFVPYFLIAPTFFFYIKSLAKPDDESLIRNGVLHAFPIALGVGLMSAWMAMSVEARQTAIHNEFWPVGTPVTVFSSMVFLAQIVSHLQILGYLIASLILLNQHLDRVRDLFSNLENRTLGWLRLAISALFCIWLADLVTDIGYVLGHFGQMGEVVVTLGELLLFYFVTFCGLRQPVIVAQRHSPPSATHEGGRPPQERHAQPGEDPRVGTAKYRKSALDQRQMQRIAEKLEVAMNSNRLFADSSLTLSDLSRSIQAPQNYVSQTLNQKMGMKFYDYIASHRVKYAKVLLSDSSNNNTILSIALEVGFNSKSTFNAAFKRLVGATPSQYRQEHR